MAYVARIGAAVGTHSTRCRPRFWSVSVPSTPAKWGCP